MWTSNRRHVYRVCGIRWHANGVFSNVLMQNKRHENRKTSGGQKVLVRYIEDTDSDILGLGFLITSSIMWISNRGHVFCVRRIRLHPTGVFSNVLMTKKRHDNRKTSDWSKSDCSVRGRYQQRYLVYYKRYRNEFCRDVYGVSLYLPTRFEPGYCKKHWSYSRSYNLRQVDGW